MVTKKSSAPTRSFADLLVEVLNGPDETQRRIADVLRFLPPRDILVLKLLYGLEGKKAHTHKAVGESFGKSVVVIRRVERQAIRRLQRSPHLGVLLGIPSLISPEVHTARFDDRTLSESIETLNLSVRGRRVCRQLNIRSNRDLVQLSADDLLECKNTGVTVINEIRQKLGERGLALRGELPFQP